MGKYYALSLAKSGFNMILASRSEEKLKSVKNIIKYEINSKIEVKIVPIDLSGKTDFSELTDHMKTKNIGVLVNNAG